MNQKNPSADDWEDCPQGTLQSLANRSRRRRVIKRAVWAVPTVLVLLLSLAWGGLLPSGFKSNSTTLACDQVINLLPAYAANSLSSTERSQVDNHLQKCPLCVAKLKSIQAGQSIARLEVRDIKGDLLGVTANRRMLSSLQ